MEIAGQRLFFPRNFLYLNRLPARFEILVVARGATQPNGVAFELEIQGQRLVLNSKAELKVGGRYELEKISATEFRLLRLVTEKEAEAAISSPVSQKQKEEISETTLASIMHDSRALPQDLLAIRFMADEKNPVEKKQNKYVFDWDQNLKIKGVFIPLDHGRYTLFIAGSAAEKTTDIEELSVLLANLGVEKIRRVTTSVLATIAAGAIDLQT